MKRIFLSLLLLSTVISINGQYVSPQVEIFIGTSSINPPSGSIEFIFNAKSTVWDNFENPNPPPDYFYFVTQNENYCSLEVSHHNAPIGSWEGWHFVTSDQGGYDSYGYGFYKLTNSYGDAVLYLDYRDSRCGYYTNTFGHPIDIWIKYNIDNDSYQISSNSTTWVDVLEHQKLNIWEIKQVGNPITYNFPDYTENNLAVYSPLTKAKLFWEAPPPQDYLPSKYRIWYAWSLVGTYQDPEPDDYYWIADVDDAFLSFTDEAIIEQHFIETASHTSYYYIEAFNGTQSLYASNIVNVFSNTDWTKTLKITNDNNHPRIAWAPYNVGDYSDYNYKVYRKVETIPPGRPPAVNKEIFATGYGDSIKLEYTDYDFTMGGSSNIASYYIKATAGSLFVSNASNIVSSNVLYYKRTNELLPEKYSLKQNYPNPFNPSTSISYSIPENAFVTLKIYDVLGNEVATLVNEEQSAGTYEVEFNTQLTANHKQLTSGVYFYTLHAGSFEETKKMILLR